MMVVGLYYDLQVDCATHLWNEFVKSVAKTNVVDGISCAHYQSLILQFAFEEGIEVPQDKDTSYFSQFNFPKIVEHDVNVFPTVVHISDAMLRKIDPADLVMIDYLKIINPNFETGMLLSSSKVKPQKGSKKHFESPSRPLRPKVFKKQKKQDHSKPTPIVGEETRCIST